MSVPPHGQVALVSGAYGGIGRALSLGLARAGLAVGLVGRDRSRLEDLLEELVGSGARGMAVTADVTRGGDVNAAVEAVERDLGPVDLLVNNAGRIESAEVPLWEADPQEWWEVVEANLRGAFLLARAVPPGMVARRRGRVVDVNSGFGARDTGVYSAYAASKAALFRVGGAIALAGAEHGVRAFEVAPGLVRSGMAGGMPMWADAPPERFTPVERTVDLVRAIAAGELDELSGCYLRADEDDVEALRAAASRIAGGDGRRLRIRPYGPDDPLA